MYLLPQVITNLPTSIKNPFFRKEWIFYFIYNLRLNQINPKNINTEK